VTPADVVITSLADDDAVQEVALGEGGTLSAIGDRTDVDCSTISPGLSAELCAALARFVALPILGAPQAARSGDAMYPAGGDSETIDGIRPVLATLSERVKYYPRPEMASGAKLASDLLAESPLVAPGVRNRFQTILEGSGPTWCTTELETEDAPGLRIRGRQGRPETLDRSSPARSVSGRCRYRLPGQRRCLGLPHLPLKSPGCFGHSSPPGPLLPLGRR